MVLNQDKLQVASGNILLIEDDHANLASLSEILRDEGYHVVAAAEGLAGIQQLESHKVDLILTDLKMPGMDGMDVLRVAKKMQPDIEVVLMTAHGTIETAVEAIKKGASDFITKPFKKAALLQILQKNLERRSLIQENLLLRGELATYKSSQRIVGKSTAIAHVLNMVKQVAPSTATVLIEGESGTGKELIAEAIHQQSERNRSPFIKVSCAALPETLLEAELFGYQKGAFTGADRNKPGRFEQANHGTLFLDEIGETSLAVQVKLLRALQDQEICRLGGTDPVKCNVRLVAATNRNLKEAVAAGEFREDLYYRLNVIAIHLPPLRARKIDIPLLSQFFLAKFNQQNKKNIESFSPAALQALQNYDWPGNVRELENTIERAVVLCQNPHIDISELPPLHPAGVQLREDVLEIPLGTAFKDIERSLIQETLKRTQGDKSLAAKLLGLGVRTIYRKLEEYGDKP